MAIFNRDRRVTTVFKVTLVVMLIMLVFLWILGGGFGKIAGTAGSFRFTSFADLLSASSTANFANFSLPWQIDMPQINVAPVEGGSGGEGGGVAPSHSTFSGNSPYAGEVVIAVGSARTQSATGQYVELDAAPSLSAPVDISGWVLESPLSGNQAYVPQAAGLFAQGQINAVADVVLGAGDRAVVTTGSSPVGVSFRESECTGYLGTLQPFVPPLPQQCPSPLQSIPSTQANQTVLGVGCFQYLQSLPACTFPASPPASLSSACVGAMQSALSYNGCTRTYLHDANFFTHSWRLFLAQGAPLWGGQHDVIRLLDRDGRVVDVINY